MLDIQITITEPSGVKDKLNQATGEEIVLARVWASKTESGGRENIYASRIVNQGEVVYTIRWREGVKPGQSVVHGERSTKIDFVIEEGRCRWMHLKCRLNNA